MPILDDEPFYGPLAIPKGMEVTPEPKQYNASVLGAAFRLENEITSYANSFSYDPNEEIDPDYNPWLDVQGTEFELDWNRFTGARTAADTEKMKAQITREREDRAVLDAAGWQGWLAQMGAGLLSPTTLLPGGAIVKGEKGIAIGKSALKIGTSAAAATAVQEAFLQGSQETRTPEESAFAIGGSFILGGMIGAAASKMTAAEFKAASKRTEEVLQSTKEFDEALRSIGAAEAKAPAEDFELRREFMFQAVKRVPGLSMIVQSDPVLRMTLSGNTEARRAAVDLVETPLQYKVNEQGRSPRAGNLSVEARTRDRERTELASAIGLLHRSFAEYSKDGPVGIVGTITAPITTRFQNLMGMERKMTATEFMDEVGKALQDGDKHPIAQVQSAADALRREIFDKVVKDAIEVGMFDEGLQLKNGKSYFHRSYETEKIARNLGNGTKDDILPTLIQQFQIRRAEAQRMLAEDDTVNRLEIDVLQRKEEVRQNQKALSAAEDKARAKRERAKSAIQRENAVGRATGSLRKAFAARAAGLTGDLPDAEAKAILKEMIAAARALSRLEPMDILGAIRHFGGIKDPRAGGRRNGLRGWTKGGQPTDLEQILGTSARTIRRNEGRDIDMMREVLVESGYLPEGATVNDLLDAIGRAAGGEKIYSNMDNAAELARYDAAKEFADTMDKLGIDLTKPFKEIYDKLYDTNAVKRAKGQEAARSGKKAGVPEGAAATRLEKAMDRLEEAKARLDELDKDIGPKVRQDINAAKEELKKLIPALKDAKAKRSAEEFFASKDDTEIETAAMDTVRSILSLKPGEHPMQVAMSSPTRARVLDVSDEILRPWLDTNAEVVLRQYFHSMVPQIEFMRTFGDIKGTQAIEAMQDETVRRMKAAPTDKARTAIENEGRAAVRDFEAMRDRMFGRYGAPEDPKNAWVVGGRVLRTVSYMGYLGGMMLAALPDVSNVIGKSGTEAFGGTLTALTDPKRFGMAIKDTQELGAAAEWWLNSRAITMAEIFDPNGRGSKVERLLGEGARQFSIFTGMIPWNVGWKSVGMAFVGSKMAKAAVAVAEGKATKKQLINLGANGIEPWMAERIAKQIVEHGDRDGTLWLPKGSDWTDEDAFKAFRAAMNREADLMVVTPGQDKPLAFSTEAGKFFLQFKSFAFSAHHRVLLAGIQRADAEVLAQVATAMALGGLVSNIKADMGGYERKSGGEFWGDALDRSGLAGWLMEPYGAASAVTGGFWGAVDPPSRFQSRSFGAGLAGPSFDMMSGVIEGSNAVATGKASYRDVRKLMRPIPGNNIWYLLPLFRKVEDAMVSATGAKPRSE